MGRLTLVFGRTLPLHSFLIRHAWIRRHKPVEQD
jgi:hypothetical protein